ncbi:MAG TPA: methyltransferase domain-containing protein [Lacipirellulaceae bacterium]|jgi:phospholipid N-methyltransferase|nr:methyltransferase domain-containing protein [Lacipirellulaceae bacterium]
MQQRLTDYKVFWRQFRQAYHTTGAVLPSGRGLSLALAHFVRNGAPNSTEPTDINRPRRILEVGPGTGAVTAQIAHDLRPDDHLILVERNDEFVNHLKTLLNSSPKFQPTRDRITLIHSSVEDLPEEPFDLIVSGLPLNNFSVELVDRLLSKLQSLLAPTGILSFFEYVAIRRAKAIVSPQRDRQRLRGIERILDQLLAKGEIRRDLVLANVPPAWVHHVCPMSRNGTSS